MESQKSSKKPHQNQQKLTYSTAVSDKTQTQTRPNVISKKQHVVSAFFGIFVKAMREQELNASTQAN